MRPIATLAANLAARAAILRAARLRRDAGLPAQVTGPRVYLLAYASSGR